MYAPWINKIFIITNGQIPIWLDINHPKIRIVSHKEIMPKTALPTFNSQAIVACIDNIKELSEYYLLGNDDTFFSGPVQPDYFFDENNNPYVNLRPRKKEINNDLNNTYEQSLQYSIKLLKEKYNIKDSLEDFVPCHCIDAYRKSYLKECKQTFANEYEKTINAKFRENNIIQSILLKFYMIYKKDCKLIKNPSFEEQSSLTEVNNLYIPLESANKVNAAFNNRKSKLLCINDCKLTTDEDRIELKYLLNKIFPKKQIWEKDFDFQIEPFFEGKFYTIVFALDNNSSKYFSATLESLISNANKLYKYDILIFSSNINDKYKKVFQKQLPSNFSLRFFDISDYIIQNYSQFVYQEKQYEINDEYYKLFIPLIMQKYQTILYLSKNVIINHDISEIFKNNFENYNIQAVINLITPLLKYEQYSDIYDYLKKGLKIKNEKTYFDDNVILFNIDAINPRKYSGSLMKILTTQESTLPAGDIANILFDNKIKSLPHMWNYCCTYTPIKDEFINEIKGTLKKEFLQAQKMPYIINYASDKKPWNSKYEENFEFFWKYARNSILYEDILFAINEGIFNSSQLENIKCNCLYQKIHNDKRIVLWGASIFLEEFLTKYNITDDAIVGIIDKNPSKQGTKIQNYTVYPPEELIKLNPEEIVITIVNSTTERKNEIKDFLAVNKINNCILSSI